MRLNVSVAIIVGVVALTIVAAIYRVSTAPERIRTRVAAARAACLNAGGQWIKVGRDEVCQQATVSK